MELRRANGVKFNGFRWRKWREKEWGRSKKKSKSDKVAGPVGQTGGAKSGLRVFGSCESWVQQVDVMLCYVISSVKL